MGNKVNKLKVSDYTLLDFDIVQKLLWLKSTCHILEYVLNNICDYNGIVIYGDDITFYMKPNGLSQLEKNDILENCDSMVQQIAKFIRENDFIEKIVIKPDNLFVHDNISIKGKSFENCRETQALHFFKNVSLVPECYVS